MTRYTNVARKRTYVQAGFNYADGGTPVEADVPPAVDVDVNIQDASSEPQKKKRKRERKGKSREAGEEGGEGGQANEEHREVPEANEADDGASSRAGKGKKHDKRMRDINMRKLASERRRLKRVDERNSDTICFACREKGHTARDCRTVIANTGEQGSKTQSKTKAKSGRDAVGLCYRCGSRRHNLSRCKEPADPSNPLPFASCFVCSGQGHLASSCPQNQSKGIYPNGGCCKLCGETTHLAKDCALRKKEVAATTLFVGTGREAGADEDDFHTFKRRDAEVNKAEKVSERIKRQVNVKVGAHSGTVRSFGKSPPVQQKKVVFFSVSAFV
ncbi:hypothetical protein A0H81_09398 [Grifola frondosa]|uniref:CCHC-type domain-containing protein n=1 Tax=Grifola frondosa TaxID=5627 RepID=A0A1C7M2N0_GRIFR|nr:hypothetical protein A0H81_09398 [Grifola frondosa]